MHRSRFPCRVCGQSTDGTDTYVICLDCAEDFELRMDGPRYDRSDDVPVVAVTSVPLSPDEIEARLRHLLDSW